METIDTIDVTHTSWVSGCSKFIFLAAPKRAFTMASLMKYDRALATTIMMRMTKSQTRSWICTVSPYTANKMNVMSATPVTP